MKKLFFTVIFISTVLFSCQPPDTPATEPYKDLAKTAMFRNVTGVIAADAAQSIALPNGKVLWLFGDSYINSYNATTNTVPCLFQVRNSANVTNVNTVETTLLGAGSPANYFDNDLSLNSKWFWPGQGYVYNNYAYVTMDYIQQVNDGLGFNTVDTLYLAKINTANLNSISYIKLGSRNGISFTHGIFRLNGYVYVYGTKLANYSNNLYVARFPETNYNAWQYYNGDFY